MKVEKIRIVGERNALLRFLNSVGFRFLDRLQDHRGVSRDGRKWWVRRADDPNPSGRDEWPLNLYAAESDELEEPLLFEAAFPEEIDQRSVFEELEAGKRVELRSRDGLIAWAAAVGVVLEGIETEGAIVTPVDGTTGEKWDIGIRYGRDDSRTIVVRAPGLPILFKGARR